MGAQHIQRLREIISQRYIHRILIIGNNPEFDITNKEVTQCKNEEDLTFNILHATAEQVRHEETQRRKQGDNDPADMLSLYLKVLLDEMEHLLNQLPVNESDNSAE